MKKTIIALLVIATAVAACSKTSGKDGGSWTFKNVTYKPTFVNYVLGAFTGYTQENLPSASLAFTFCDSPTTVVRGNVPMTTPPHTGLYRIASINPPDSGYVYIRMTDTAVTRNYISVFDSTKTISVTVSADSTSTMVEFSGILLKSNHDATDIGTLAGKLVQINYK